MGIVSHAKDTLERASGYIRQLTDLCKSSDINGPTAPIKLVRQWRSNLEFREKWNKVWNELASAEGGKITLTTVSVIIGAVLGGVGVAALGGAVGLPLAVVLVPFGYVVGNELDQHQTRRFWRWIRGKGTDNESSREHQTLLLAAADLETLKITIGELASRCEHFEKKILEIAANVDDYNSRIISTEQHIAILNRQMRTLRWTSGGALVLAGLAIIGLLARL